MKELKFVRTKGLVGSMPRNWIDRTLPRCPFCKTAEPLWESAMEHKMKLNLYHFRCAKCGGIVSIPVAAVANTAPLTLAGALLHAKAERSFTVESIGSSGSQLAAGTKLAVEEMRRIAQV